jgi:thiamine pyrophosphokinase
MNSIGPNRMIVESSEGVTLAGGAPFGRSLLARARAIAPRLVAADGGADRLFAHGAEPEAVIGDLDSISIAARARLAGRLHPVLEQQTTDFDKALRLVNAPFVLALGFWGARADHGLAVLNALVRHERKPCLVLSASDVIFHARADMAIDLPKGSRLSLFPMAPVTGKSEGLDWPIGGIRFTPGGDIGCSNRVTAGPVRLWFEGPGMLVILPVRSLEAALKGLDCAPSVRGG